MLDMLLSCVLTLLQMFPTKSSEMSNWIQGYVVFHLALVAITSRVKQDMSESEEGSQQT